VHEDIKAIQAEVEKHHGFVDRLKQEIHKVIVGQEYLIDHMIMALLADGHILLEGVPGLAKTLSVRTLCQAISVNFQRLQFTPDLLPADLVGTMVYSQADGQFRVKKGPIFTNMILADEINRAPAKVQSALLEAMQERQVTIGDTTYPLPQPFLVMATQNPIEQEGTYPLPEAQVDRFMFKLKVTYPSKAEELEILNRMTIGETYAADSIIKPDEILDARKVLNKIYVDDKVKEYIVDVVFATRNPEAYNLPIADLVEYGASPRATIYLTIASKAHAFLKGRGYITPDDVKTVGADVLRHRVIVSYEAEAEEVTSEDIVAKVFNEVEVP
jgi:MoxR-like ATPase